MSRGPSLDASSAYRLLVGRRSGIVRRVWLTPPVDGDAPLHYVAATIANPQSSVAAGPRLGASGASPLRDQAMIAAMCEGLERYAAAAYAPQATLRTAAEQPNALPPQMFTAFSREQRSNGLPFPEVDDSSRLRWSPAIRLDDNSQVAAPAFAVHLPYVPQPCEPLPAPGISTGLACANEFGEALRRGLCEVIERDALALTWLKRVSPLRVPEGWLRESARGLLPPRDDVRAYDLTSDLEIPVMLVICRGRGRQGSLLSVGSACHPDPHEALRKAALEASQDRVYVRLLRRSEPNWRPEANDLNVTDFSRHAMYYSVLAHRAEAAFAFLDHSSGRSQPDRFTQPRLSCEQLVARLKSAGHASYAVDLTPPWAADHELSVVKALAPTLLPLHGNHHLPFLAHPRLASVADSMPHGSAMFDGDFNRDPHPFP